MVGDKADIEKSYQYMKQAGLNDDAEALIIHEQEISTGCQEVENCPNGGCKKGARYR